MGAGGGYYSAILAELVAWNGWVTAIEYEPDLAALATRALADRPNVEVLAGDAHALLTGPADLIVASCGFDAVPVAWVRALSDGGRLMLPLTTASPMPGIGAGGMLLVTRRGERFEAAFVSEPFTPGTLAARKVFEEELVLITGADVRNVRRASDLAGMTLIAFADVTAEAGTRQTIERVTESVDEVLFTATTKDGRV